MVKFLSATLFAASLVAATPSFAAVLVVDHCASVDGQYSVSILDNQGIGLDRTSHLYATITDTAGTVVGTYDVINASKGIQPVSFGHPTLIDTASKGSQFILDLGSTNTPAQVKAVLTDGSAVALELSCSKL